MPSSTPSTTTWLPRSPSSADSTPRPRRASTRTPPTEPAVREALAAGLDSTPSPTALELADYLARIFGPSTVAVIHYGSHAQRSDARPESAHDFFVVVDRYPQAYEHLTRVRRTRFSTRTAVALAHVLPPSVLAVTVPREETRDGVAPLQAKCAILSLADFARCCGPRAKDHFTKGRLFQHVQLVWTRDEAGREAVVSALVAARWGTFEWVRPYLPSVFNADTYCRVLLETSFAGEIRPEGNQRVAQLYEAQHATLRRIYEALLRYLADRRLVTPEGNVYRLTTPVGPLARARGKLYFARSKARATARWSKHIALYEDWLPYIVQKIGRRTGQQIDLTERERRWPLIFLWPRAIRFILSRPQRQARR